MKKTSLALGVALALFGCGSGQPDKGTAARAVQPKSAAPDFELDNVAGGKLKAADLKGKVTIVDFWATWCEPCIAEIPNWNNIQATHGDEGVTMLGITVESGPLKDIKPKVEALKMNYPVVVGNDAVVEGFGGLIGFPTTFIVTKDWKVYKKYLGMTSNKKAQIEKDIGTLLAAE